MARQLAREVPPRAKGGRSFQAAHLLSGGAHLVFKRSLEDVADELGDGSPRKLVRVQVGDCSGHRGLSHELEKKRRSELRKRRRRAEVSKCNHEPGRKAASERGRASNERGRQAE
jgi:hypothetical protein